MTKDHSDPTHKIVAIDQSGKQQEIFVVDEVPLTLKLDGFEIVTLMTLGNQPEELALGYLRNQGLIDKIEEIASIAVDWQNETVNVKTRKGAGIRHYQTEWAKPTVTSGCGQWPSQIELWTRFIDRDFRESGYANRSSMHF